MNLTKPQSSIFLNESRFRVVVAGRRFGKTYLSTVEILKEALSAPERNVWYLAPTYKAAKEIAWEMLLNLTPRGYIAKTNEPLLTINLINGSTISLKGAEKPDNLRGRALDFCVLDELADMRKEAWFEVIRPSLSDREGKALFIGTPKGRNHFYDLHCKGIDKDEGWSSFQYTTLDGGNVPEDEISQAQADLDERTFMQEYQARFVNYAGIIYYSFDRAESVKKINGELPDTIHIGMDFNIDPMSATVAVRDGRTLTISDEIVIFGSSTDEMVDEIKTRYPKKHVIVYPDPASRQRRTSAAGRTDLSILQNAGFDVRVKTKHTAVRDRINAVNSKLCSAKLERSLFVSSNCKKTIASLERQTYKEGTSQPDKDGGFDHMNDALGYLVDYLFPIRKQFEAQEPTRWT